MGFTGTKHFNKYGNKKINSLDGVFDSKFEYEEWCKLKLLQRAGVVSSLERQVPISLLENFKTSQGTIRGIKYIADFVYIESGIKCIVDTKGYETDEYKIKKKLLLNKLTNEVFIERKKGKKDKIYRRDI